MSRRSNGESRCARCRMHRSLCVCPLIPTLRTRTRLLLVMHFREERKPSNSGRLAVEAMPSSQLVVRGHEDKPEDSLVIDPTTRPLFLFPHEDAVPLATVASVVGDDRPVTLIVPDGNWRQASKVRQRVAGLRDVPSVSLPGGEPSIHRVRKESHPVGMTTLEAIAHALRLLEGDEGPEIERALLEVSRAMVGRTLWSRGTIEASSVAGGVPTGARRDVPWPSEK